MDKFTEKANCIIKEISNPNPPLEPTKKSPGIENLLTKMAGVSRQDAAAQRVCTMCKGPAEKFTDELSKKEYQISGLCQACQDKIFNSGEEDAETPVSMGQINALKAAGSLPDDPSDPNSKRARDLKRKLIQTASGILQRLNAQAGKVSTSITPQI